MLKYIKKLALDYDVKLEVIDDELGDMVFYSDDMEKLLTYVSRISMYITLFTSVEEKDGFYYMIFG